MRYFMMRRIGNICVCVLVSTLERDQQCSSCFQTVILNPISLCRVISRTDRSRRHGVRARNVAQGPRKVTRNSEA